LIEDEKGPNKLRGRATGGNPQLGPGQLGGPDESAEVLATPKGRDVSLPYDRLTIEDIPDDIAVMLDADEARFREASQVSTNSLGGGPPAPECELNAVAASNAEMTPPDVKSPHEMRAKNPTTMLRRRLVSTAVRVLRWILLIPVSLACGLVAFYVVQIGNRLTMPAADISPEDFLPRLFIEAMSGAAAFGVFTILGYRIAPSHKTGAAYGLAVVALIIGGRIAFEAFPVANYWALVRVAGGIIGVAAAVRSVLTSGS